MADSIEQEPENADGLNEEQQDAERATATGKRFSFGCLKGLITVPDDFDSPLDDFKGYT